MLISYPFLPGRTKNAQNETEKDDAYETRLSSYENNSFAQTHELFDEGIYPVSFDGRWHGGIHMQPGEATEPIRAIADGEVVAYRYADAALYAHTDTDKKFDCDNSFVLLIHKTETGEGVTVEYYSLYMHLANSASNTKQALLFAKDKAADFMRSAKAAGPDAKATVPAAATRPKVYRKQILGYAGQMYGKRMIHFEIFLTPTQLDAFFKDSKTTYVDANKNGTDELWGDVYFVIPGDISYKKQPDIADAKAKAKYGALTERASNKDGKTLYVSWRYSKGQRKMTVWEDGNPEPLATDVTPAGEADYEYDLSKLAHSRYDTCPSAGYELLRWGRMLGPDKTKLNTDALKANWQAMPYSADGKTISWGYVNLSDSKVLKLSDADFPHWLGWKKVPSASNPDGTVDIKALQEVFKDIDTDNDKTLSKDELTAWLKDAKAKRKFKHLVVQSPSEWDKAHNGARYNGLKDAGKVFDPAKDAGGKNWTEFNTFIEKFQWWTDAGLGSSKDVWHFHPIQFIQQFKRCGWVDKGTLARIYKSTSESTREKYRVALNRMLQKYLFTTAERQIHLFGQGAIESARLTNMIEASQEQKKDANGKQVGGKVIAASQTTEDVLGHWYGAIPSEVDSYYSDDKYNRKGVRFAGSYSWLLGNCGDTDAQKFRGRGFKQLTGRSNYASYWVYRGWLKTADFDASWWSDPKWIARKVDDMKKRPAPVDDPQQLSVDPLNTMDSGGWYLCFERPKVKVEIDKDKPVVYPTSATGKPDEALIKSVTAAINGGHNGLPERIIATREAKIILLDGVDLFTF